MALATAYGGSDRAKRRRLLAITAVPALLLLVPVSSAAAAPPKLTIAGASVKEGNHGTRKVVFTVSLSRAVPRRVTVRFGTSDETATAGSDYIAKNGKLAFKPRQRTLRLAVAVRGDVTNELNERFRVKLSRAAGARLGRAAARATIRNDDPLPTAFVDGRPALEGDDLVFTVRLSGSSDRTVTSDYATSSGSATAGADYTPAAGTLAFAPFELSKEVRVAVAADSVDEPDESVRMTLSDPTNAKLRSAPLGNPLVLARSNSSTGQHFASVVRMDVSGTVDRSWPDIPMNGVGTALAMSDVTRDGRADLFATHFDDDHVSVMAGSASGSFSTSDGTTVATGDEPQSPSLGDVNGDGRKDLVVVNRDPTSETGSVSVLRSNGDLTFLPKLDFATGADFATGYHPTDVAMGDVDGDGELDLAVANYGSNTVSLLSGNGDATFSPAGSISVAGGPWSLVLSHLDEDADLDLAVANRSADTISILVGGPGLTFTLEDTLDVGDQPLEVVAGDFDGDGATDLAAANWSSDTISILTGTGSGAFDARTLAAGDQPHSLAIGDLTGDGNLDLAIANLGSALVLRGRGDATFAKHRLGVHASAVAIGENGANDVGHVATAIIADDDPVPGISVGDRAVPEPFAATQFIAVDVTLTRAYPRPVEVDWSTADGTAHAGSDYNAASGSVTFAPGETSKTISLIVRGDSLVEADETFTVTLSNPTNGTVVRSGTITILNND